ncbi:NAD(P)H-binding protein [Rhodoferax sp.]|uniref:NAD(P)H-binding protein n=1 Tax=Rhodoferax sp. TaxID=50421 RepID=UPI00374D5D9A
MKVLLFGATGMVGQGVLRECLQDAAVTLVQTVGRTPIGQQHSKLRELVLTDMHDLSAVAADLTGFDACFFCLGATSAGLTEAQYTRVSYDLTLAAAEVLARCNPQMVFIYVSGAGTDSSERGSSMWARVKGRTENALLRQPFKAVYLFRPGVIQPLDGVQSKTGSYRIFYSLAKPLLPLLRALLPNQILTTRQVGLAMLHCVKAGAPQAVLESRDIRALTL